jgi:hypothetical protein
MTTVAERLTARGLKNIVLPSSGETILIRRPKTVDLMRIGLFPLRVAAIDLKSMPPDEWESVMKEVDRAAVKIICECCVEPRVVSRTAHPGEMRIDALDADDFTFLQTEILDFATSSLPEAPTEDHPHAELNHQGLALACERFRVDPTRAENWPPERAERLIYYAKLAVKNNGS